MKQDLKPFFFFFIWSHKLKSLYLSHPLLVLPTQKYALNGEFRWGNVPSPRLNSQEGFFRLCLTHADGRAACILGPTESWTVSSGALLGLGPSCGNRCFRECSSKSSPHFKSRLVGSHLRHSKQEHRPEIRTTTSSCLTKSNRKAPRSWCLCLSHHRSPPWKGCMRASDPALSFVQGPD